MINKGIVEAKRVGVPVSDIVNNGHGKEFSIGSTILKAEGNPFGGMWDEEKGRTIGAITSEVEAKGDNLSAALTDRLIQAVERQTAATERLERQMTSPQQAPRALPARTPANTRRP